MTQTVADRAAVYFGIFQQPRRSVSLGKHQAAVFARDRLYLYDDRAWPTTAISIQLTDSRREALMIELERGLSLA